MSDTIWNFFSLAIIFVTARGVTLTGEATFVIANDDLLNNTALNLTIQDVMVDFYHVLGLVPIIESPNDVACPLASEYISRIYFGTFYSNPQLSNYINITQCYSGKESHCLILKYNDPVIGTALFAISNDTRGAIYAAYSFSELILGIDPLYRFSGISGVYHGSFGFQSSGITNISNSYKKIFGAPLFEYRALFNNDEDLLGGWGSDPYGQAVHSGTIFNWLFESILRMKGNMMIVGTIPYPDEISIGLASKRGLVITNHHFNLMASNTFRFPSELNDEWDFITAPQTLKFVWESSRDALKRNVEPYMNEIVWSVGWRGRNDEAAPCTGYDHIVKLFCLGF